MNALHKEVIFALLASGRVPHVTAEELIAEAEPLVDFIEQSAPIQKGESAYWPDKSDPLAMVHGREKVDRLCTDILALKFLFWKRNLAVGSDASDKIFAMLVNKYPGFADDVQFATTQLALFDSGTEKLLSESAK